MVAATMASDQKWFPVATTTNTVTAGCSRISQRQRIVPLLTTAQETSSAQATCTEGIAES